MVKFVFWPDHVRDHTQIAVEIETGADRIPPRAPGLLSPERKNDMSVWTSVRTAGRMITGLPNRWPSSS